LMKTPPTTRLPVKTSVSKYSRSLIEKAIDFEIKRGGQIFYVHNRVKSIFEKAKELSEIYPKARIVVAHGQMPESLLEKSILKFLKTRADILLSTSIIESGLDIPTANTIIIENCDRFGLAQLHQMRGRVGRSSLRAYCYLLYRDEKSLTEEARLRLDAIQRHVGLGVGFGLASQDLEIRGGGNLLGADQSGHIQTVGYDLFLDLVRDAVNNLKGDPKNSEQLEIDPEIKIPVPAFIPESYTGSGAERIRLYRRLSAASLEDLEAVSLELRDRFGPIPPEVKNLMLVIQVKSILKRYLIEEMSCGQRNIIIKPSSKTPLSLEKVMAKAQETPSKFKLLPDSRLSVAWAPFKLEMLPYFLEELFESLR